MLSARSPVSVKVALWTLFAAVIMVITVLPSQVLAFDPDAPSSPSLVNATPGNGTMELVWNYPMYSNASEVMEYRVYRGETNITLDLVVTLGNVTGYLDIGLVNGKTYFYSVSAINSAGEGPRSDLLNATPLTVPNRPRSVNLVPGNMFINVTWGVPDFDGGSPVIGYVIYRSDSGSMIRVGSVINQTYFIDSLLVIGHNYTYYVAAFNLAGEGIVGLPAVGASDIVPGSAKDIAVFEGVRNATLTWRDPALNGGSSILGYKIYRGNSTLNITLLTVVEPSNSFLDLGLQDNTTYYYQVVAFNKVGDGVMSYIVYTATFGTPIISLNAVKGGDRSVVMFWFPIDDGGTTVVRYWIYRGSNETNPILYATLGDQLNFVDLGVENGVTYFYRIAGENAVGVGLSQVLNCTPCTNASAPLDLKGESQDYHVILNWSLPASTGGAAILAYNIYRAEISGQERYIGSTNLTTYISAGLEIGRTYYYHVSAVNRAGEGAPSVELAIKSGRTPSVPRELKAFGWEGKVQLFWKEPTESGTSEVRYYSVYRSNNSAMIRSVLVANVTDTSYGDVDVTNGDTYYYHVQAMNSIGYGPFTTEVMAQPHLNGTVPGVPLNLQIVNGSDFIQLSWEAPSKDGGKAITGYAVYRGIMPDMMVYFRTVNSTSLNNTNLGLGLTYYYKVAAINSIGTGPSTGVMNGTTVLPPAPEEQVSMLWQVLGSMFFYVGIILGACALAVWFIMRRRRRKKARMKGARMPQRHMGAPQNQPRTAPAGQQKMGQLPKK